MIEPGKLNTLAPGQKRRKLALTFGALERDICGIAEEGSGYSFSSMPRADYVGALSRIVRDDPLVSVEDRAEIGRILEARPFGAEGERRLCNVCRNALLRAIGTFPAEWDLVIAPHRGENSVEKRDFFPGVFVYAEDIRSPFNIGSIFRTAEAMGAEGAFISPRCVDPTHPKSLRSGMGCVQALGFERKSLEELTEFSDSRKIPIFVLETGGTDIREFDFPKKGICIIGSEELGVSPEALSAATYGRVSIPMKGLKASLNVGVAFGVLMEKWAERLSVGEGTVRWH